MQLPYEGFIGLRYFAGARGRGFLSFIAGVSTSGSRSASRY